MSWPTAHELLRTHVLADLVRVHDAVACIAPSQTTNRLNDAQVEALIEGARQGEAKKAVRALRRMPAANPGRVNDMIFE